MKLSRNHHALVVEIIRLTTQARTVEDLDHILNGPLRKLLGYEVMICGTGFYSEKGCYGYKYHSLDFPMEYFFELRNPASGGVDSPLMQRWRETTRPIIFQSGRDDADYPESWVRLFNKYELRNTLAHATLDRHGVVGNYFIFARLNGDVGEDLADVLELITPTLSQALELALQNEECEDNFPGTVNALISKRQREILQWIYQGKTNWEISKILDINEETVKYHIDQAMNKLNVKTRAQAVGRALEIGAISANKRIVTTPPSHHESEGKPTPASKRKK